MSYQEFAAVYDQLQTDVDYKARTEYLVKLFQKYDRLPTLLLDVACGTGDFTIAIARKAAGFESVEHKSLTFGICRMYICKKPHIKVAS